MSLVLFPGSVSRSTSLISQQNSLDVSTSRPQIDFVTNSSSSDVEWPISLLIRGHLLASTQLPAVPLNVVQGRSMCSKKIIRNISKEEHLVYSTSF